MALKITIERERTATSFLYPVFIVCVLSGLITWMASAHTNWVQWTVIVHIIAGAIVSVYAPLYLLTHVKRTLGFRRLGTLFSGLLSLFLLLGFIVSGWHILIYGQMEAYRWVFNVHIYCGLGFLFLVLIHLVLHLAFFPSKRIDKQLSKTPSISQSIWKYIGFATISILLIIGGLSIAIGSGSPVDQSLQPSENYTYPYGAGKFLPSQTETASGSFVNQNQIAGSSRCISCHTDLGMQWLSSVHKQAASDPAYVTNINLLVGKRGIEAARYCEGCHAPVALLTGELTPGGKHGGIPETPAHNEGVSCMSCHGVHALTHLKGVASYEFTPAKDYLFANSTNPVLTLIHDRLIKVKPDQHKQDLASPLLKDPKFCASCHTQFMDKDLNNWGWIKMQDEYGAWVASPFSKQHDQNFSNSEIVRCQDCHMPLKASKDPSANSQGMVRGHHFPGANTFLPILQGDIEQYQATVDFMQANRMQVSIDKPSRKDTVQTFQALDEDIRHFEEAPFFFYIGEKADINVVVSNLAVGHNFPGGTIDIGEAWIEAVVVDIEGTEVFSSGKVQADGHVDKQAYFYKSIPVDRFGKEVWRHDLFNMVGESFKRVIPAGKSDIVGYSFTIPAWAKAPLTLTATLKQRKLNKRYASWALKEKYIPIPIIDIAWDSLEIPIQTRKPVEPNTISQPKNGS